MREHAPLGDRARRVASSSISISRSMPSPPGARTRAAAPAAERVAADAHRIRALERLDRRVARVRHRGVHAVHARAAARAGRPARRRSSRSTPSRRRRAARCSSCPATRRRPDRARPARARRGTRRRRAGSPRRCPAPTATGSRAATIEPGGATHAHRPQRAAVRGEVGIDDRSQREHDRADRHRLDRVHRSRRAARRCR